MLTVPGANARQRAAPGAPQSMSEAPSHGFSALVFSRTTGFRHASIEAGITAVTELGAEHEFDVTATEDPSVFTPESLAAYDVVIFLNTTGDVLDAAQQEAFEAYVTGGGGYVGIHSAADTEYDWPFYGELVGAWFDSHPPGTPTADVKVVDRVHPATADLPANWTRTDEWYNYRTNPRGNVHVLATLDESTYGGGTMGADHPIAWCQPVGGGRSFYTAGGHTSEAFSEPLFREHLLGGIEWAAGAVDGDCSATLGASFERVILEDGLDNPMQVVVTPDLDVIYVQRGGEVRIVDGETGVTSTAGDLNVVTANEDGLLGIALDPDFATNGRLYLFYSPAGGQAIQRVSRFTLTGGVLDMGSEAVLLEIPVQRAQCCHSAGALAFGPGGDLYISTG
ncbi:MAG: ThuA domain-containing protein, partial [Rhodothermales bacterium]|nr:ThuA domain-containing protein [Rhodothermales bacterium]